MTGIKKFRLKRSYFSFPYAVLSVLFVILPLLITAFYAFTRDGSFSFANFVKFFTTPNTLKVLLYSLGIAALVTVICLLLAYPLAMMLADSKINRSAVTVMLFIMPMWINSLLRTYAMKNVFQLIGMTNAYAALIIGLVYYFFPFMLLRVYSVLSNMDKSYMEAANDLGCGAVQSFFKVRLPLSLPGIMSGVLMVFMPTVSTFAISDILGDTSTYMFGNIINDWFTASGGSGWNIGSAYSLILLALIGITMFIANKATGGKASAAGAAQAGGGLL